MKKTKYIFMMLIGVMIFVASLISTKSIFAENLVAAAPVVNANNSVTFTLLAPDASNVVLEGDYPLGTGYRRVGQGIHMIKGANGVWSVTVDPLPSEIYSYFYWVDGVPTLDPNNATVTRDGEKFASWIAVSGAGANNYQINNVPHGTVSEIWYESPTLKAERRLCVYTPPGYEMSNKQYPVLYLIHGGGGDEEAWINMGRAAQIFDNLLAQNKIVPMIVVFPNGNDWEKASPNYIKPAKPSGVDPKKSFALFPESITSDLIPFIDKTYRTKADRDDRAIAGLSRGGAQALYSAFNHIDKYAWVGVFSGGLPLMPNTLINIPMPSDASLRRGPDVGHSIDVNKFSELLPQLNKDANARLHAFYISLGTSDGLVESWQSAQKLLDQKGVKYTWRSFPGYGHEWRAWRLSLQEFSQLLFR